LSGDVFPNIANPFKYASRTSGDRFSQPLFPTTLFGTIPVAATNKKPVTTAQMATAYKNSQIKSNIFKAPAVVKGIVAPKAASNTAQSQSKRLVEYTARVMSRRNIVNGGGIESHLKDGLQADGFLIRSISVNFPSSFSWAGNAKIVCEVFPQYSDEAVRQRIDQIIDPEVQVIESFTKTVGSINTDRATNPQTEVNYSTTNGGSQPGGSPNGGGPFGNLDLLSALGLGAGLSTPVVLLLAVGLGIVILRR
jgi:hypothetical protein